MDGNIVWKNVSVPATMMECPDIFALGDASTFMLIGSLYSTNQWWVGSVAGSPPRFTPQTVGIMDYGNGYAAKTGSTFASLPGDRRVVFGFTGWTEPTQPHGCGRALIIPRDITLGADGASPRINPIPELQSLRVAGSERRAADAGALAGGAQVWVALQCAFSSTPAWGAAFSRVLQTPDGATEFVEVGYDFGAQALYVNHSICCAGRPNGIVQLAPAHAAALGGLVNITILVDGGLIEVFLNGLVTITALVDPSNVTHAADRISTAASSANGVDCSVTLVWKFHFLSIPGMAWAGFATILALMGIAAAGQRRAARTVPADDVPQELTK
jgi:sucrose-6-phosphate hydrolase SacC (GH32 family)